MLEAVCSCISPNVLLTIHTSACWFSKCILLLSAFGFLTKLAITITSVVMLALAVHEHAGLDFLCKCVCLYIVRRKIVLKWELCYFGETFAFCVIAYNEYKILENSLTTFISVFIVSKWCNVTFALCHLSLLCLTWNLNAPHYFFQLLSRMS